MDMKDFLDYTPTWFQGPSFLSKPETEWPDVEVEELPEDDPEIKTVNTTLLQNPVESPLSKLISYCSSWIKLKKFVGYYLLFFSYLKVKTSQKKLTETEVIRETKLDVQILQKSEKVILTQVQHSCFQELFDALENQRPTCVSKPIRKLDPIIVDGLIRVGGRLSRSSLDFEAKYPVLLPKESRVTDLIVRDAHEAVGHLGKAAMTTNLRQKYWILGLGYLIKNITSKCVICRSYMAQQRDQKMADLPLDRVSCDEAPFMRVGVDFFGPFAAKRGRSNVKRYGVVFTCLASRAIHLEVASQLDTSSCINAIRRFIARRGCPKKIWSDNGTNFIGSKRELNEAVESWNLHQIQQEMLQKGIMWEFNPPMGSHFGGAWERMIRTVRKIMYSLLRSQVIKLDDEGIHTLFCEIESIVNNRPITTVSSDINDLSPLTPNHILLLRSGEKLPPGLYSESNCCPNAWIRYGNSCYMFIGTKETWMEASQQCVVRGAHLATIETADENAFITGYLKVFGDIGAYMVTWVGGNDMEIEGIWKWSASGERVTYTDWEPKEPEGCATCGDCMVIWPNYNYKWGDYPCHNQANFICEKQITDGSLVG
ncbi:uncharacterized protein LOC124269595 [Haliotis rubra]|uniref:uncharacterized protein LOC124269595 n=1 Tax=Haliotis rubra TaxID=36100 RepID=UPI001EE52D3F|nr:uncharacterized protein LOC124269595 [Haliotis rubra]